MAMKCPHCNKDFSQYLKSCPYCQTPVKTGKRWAVIQIETTGLEYRMTNIKTARTADEILRIVLLDENGDVFFNQFYRPLYHSSWDEAYRINGISPEMVKNRPILNMAEVDKLNYVLLHNEIDFLVTNSGKFVSGFLNLYKIQIPHGGIYSISELFEEYQEANQIQPINRTLNNIAKYFQYDAYKIADREKTIEKAIKIWYCYKHLTLLDKNEVLSEMCGTGSAGGLTYELFFDNHQILDYLKSIGVCNAAEKSMPNIYYNGRFTAEPTVDCFILGLKTSRTEDKDVSVERIIMSVKGKLIALTEGLFVNMQKVGEEIQSACNDNPLLLSSYRTALTSTDKKDGEDE